MTQPQRKIVGSFTKNFEYTVNGEPLSHPVWAPRKPNERPIHQFPNNAIKFY